VGGPPRRVRRRRQVDHNRLAGVVARRQPGARVVDRHAVDLVGVQRVGGQHRLLPQPAAQVQAEQVAAGGGPGGVPAVGAAAADRGHGGGGAAGEGAHGAHGGEVAEAEAAVLATGEEQLAGVMGGTAEHRVGVLGGYALRHGTVAGGCRG
jgi:hypothetical protein